MEHRDGQHSRSRIRPEVNHHHPQQQQRVHHHPTSAVSQLIDSPLMALIAALQSKNRKWTEKITFEEEQQPTEEVFEIGLGDDNLIHSIQLGIFLKQSALAGTRIGPTPRLIAKNHARFNPVTNLTHESVQELLKRSVVLICVNSGFEVTTESTLQILVDLCGVYMTNICKRLKKKSETVDLRKSEDFEIEVSQVFDEIGAPLEKLNSHLDSIRSGKARLIRQAQVLHGVSIETPLVPASPKPTTPPEEQPIPYEQFLVGLDDFEPPPQNGKADWEKSLDELGVNMDASCGDLNFDIGS